MQPCEENNLKWDTDSMDNTDQKDFFNSSSVFIRQIRVPNLLRETL